MLDELDKRILEILSSDARIAQKELARRIRLSAPSVAERLHHLREQGIIRCYTIDIEPQKVGYALQAIVRIRPLPGKTQAVEALIADTAEFSECDKVTGDDCFIGRLHFRSMDQLDQILRRIADKAETSTAIVKSQPVRRRMPPL